jgi:hypothetical protein
MPQLSHARPPSSVEANPADPAILATGSRSRIATVIFSYPREFPADDVERRVPDAATAQALMRERRPDLLALIEQRLQRFAKLLAGEPAALVEHARDAVLIGFCRVAYRHGSWGEDFHAYHNENHVVEILGPRTERLIETVGMRALVPGDWFLLALFAATHDLRQREAPLFEAGIGSNERASVEETLRILEACGFSPKREREIFVGIELMISGSTFDARPPPSMLEYNTAELLVQSRGALARKLDKKLDKHAPGWRNDARIMHALTLAQIAADLDTANVAEPFPIFMASAERLCREREMRSHRDPDQPETLTPVLNFLTVGQERYFFDLHRFGSEFGRRAFEAGKLDNAEKLKALTSDLYRRATSGELRTGNEVLAACREITATLG